MIGKLGKNMEWLYLIIFVLVVLVVRAGKARNRLQACIDNGSVILNEDGCIEISSNLPPDQHKKIEVERRFYLKHARTFPGSMRLHKRNSQY